METELGEYSRENKDLKRQLEHMELKLRATNREIKRERKQVGFLIKPLSVSRLFHFDGTKPHNIIMSMIILLLGFMQTLR